MSITENIPNLAAMVYKECKKYNVPEIKGLTYFIDYYNQSFAVMGTKYSEQKWRLDTLEYMKELYAMSMTYDKIHQEGELKN